MYLLVTFGQSHVHRINSKTFDRDCVGVIQCDNEEDGRKILFE